MDLKHLVCAVTVSVSTASVAAVPWEVVPTDYTRIVDGQEVGLAMARPTS